MKTIIKTALVIGTVGCFVTAIQLGNIGSSPRVAIAYAMLALVGCLALSTKQYKLW